MTPVSALLRWLLELSRGDPEVLRDGIETDRLWPHRCLVVMVAGAGLYGATIGLWRAPLQAVFTGLKFPLVVFLTTGGNALINGMLAWLLGLGITFRQSFTSILTAFAISSCILGSLSPVTLFLLLNTEPLGSADPFLSHHVLLLVHVVLIGFAGVVGNIQLYRLLVRLAGNQQTARRVLASWLALNVFFGCQISWSLRPFVGTPGLPVEFLRSDALDGTFYESIYRVLVNLSR
ncbi:MAG: hypothetical protein AB1486_21670 [Planctomycetota bacterium]